MRQLGWEWVMLQGEGQAKAISVASPNRSHVVPVLQYIEKLATDPDADNTAILLYNMILAGDVTPAEAGALTVMR